MAQDKKKKTDAPAADARHLSLEETDEIVDFYMFNAFRIAMGTMFCIVSPVVAVLIDGFNTASLIPEEAAELLESMSIIIFVAIAACMFLVGPTAGVFLPINGRLVEAAVSRFRGK